MHKFIFPKACNGSSHLKETYRFECRQHIHDNQLPTLLYETEAISTENFENTRIMKRILDTPPTI